MFKNAGKIQSEYTYYEKQNDSNAVEGIYKMTRIMFVCHGNICRSPMAEMIARALIKERGLAGKLEVASSATSDEEIYRGVGNPIYPPARAELLKNGIPIDYDKRAIRLTREDRDKYDLFVGMDSANIRNMKYILGEGAKDKIHKLMSFAGVDSDVSDPWYSDRFDIAYRDIYVGVSALLDTLS